MLYKDARPLIKSGDLISFSHGSWNSIAEIKTNIVRMATRSNYSHVGVAWVVGGRVFILEAVIPKVRIYPMSISGDFFWLPMKAPWGDVAQQFAFDSIGVDYSQWVAIRSFFGPLGRTSAQQCSAFTQAIYAADGIDLGKRVTPDAIVQAAQEMGAPCHFVENGHNK